MKRTRKRDATGARRRDATGARKRDATGARRRDASRPIRARRRNRNRRAKQDSRAVIASRHAARGVRRLLPLMFGLLALTGGGTGVMFGWRALCESERLQIRAVDIKGNHRVRGAEIHAYTNIGMGDSILRADLDGAALSLRRHPWIATARVQRQLPDRIMIEIEEHEATLVVALGELYLANASGELFKKLSADDGVVLPVLTGIARERVMQDPTEVAISIGDAIALHNSMLASGRALGALQELHWDDDLGWSVVTQPKIGGPHLTVHLGFAAEERVPLAVAALAGLQASGRRPRVVWADGRTRERVHIQLLGDVGESKNRTLMAQAR